MKRYRIITVLLVSALLFIIGIRINPAPKKNALSSPYNSKSESKDEYSKEVQLKRAKVILESQDWKIGLEAISGSQAGMEDTLTFSEGRIISRNLSGQGYPRAKYILSFIEDGRVIWEAFQESQSAGIASWRGELKGESAMRGILSLQSKSGRLEDFFFKAGTSFNIGLDSPADNNIKERKAKKKTRRR